MQPGDGVPGLQARTNTRRRSPRAPLPISGCEKPPVKVHVSLRAAEPSQCRLDLEPGELAGRRPQGAGGNRLADLGNARQESRGGDDHGEAGACLLVDEVEEEGDADRHRLRLELPARVSCLQAGDAAPCLIRAHGLHVAGEGEDLGGGQAATAPVAGRRRHAAREVQVGAVGTDGLSYLSFSPSR